MRILFLSRSLDVGGAERQLTLLAKGLAGRGHAVAVAVFYAGGPFQAELEAAGVPVLDLAKAGRWDLAGFFARLLRVIKDFRPDVLHPYLGTANILSVLARPLTRTGKVVWGVRASDLDWGRYDRMVRLTYRVECGLSRLAHLVIANSYAGKAFVVGGGFDPGKVVVVHNGIDVERFAPPPEQGPDRAGAIRRRWGLDEHALVLGTPARLNAMKDHPTLLRAAAMVGAKEPRARFVCLGQGPPDYLADLRGQARALGLGDRALFPGLEPDMPGAYAAMDLCVLPSAFGEGFPNVLAEAMACGAPCVATDVGDAVRVVGDVGATVPPGDPEALARAVLTMLERLEREGRALQEAVRRRIVEHFSQERLVADTEALLKGLLERG